MSTYHPGRFNTSDIGAVYVSQAPTTAVEELRRRAKRDGTPCVAMHPRCLFVLDLSLQVVLNLTNLKSLEKWALTERDLVSEDFTRCQEVATVAAAQGTEAIRWNSATGEGRSLAVFIGQLLPGSSIEIVEEIELSQRDLVQLDAGVSPKDLLGRVKHLR